MKIIQHNIRVNNEKLNFYAPEHDTVVPGTLAGVKNGTWHFDKIKFKEGDNILDIGCNIGIISMIFAKLFPSINIFSFDPNPLAIDCFKTAIQDNHIRNINTFNAAVGVEAGSAEFITYSENETCLIQKDLSANERNVCYRSEIISIDYIFDNILIGKDVKFAKIDIETGEFNLFNHLFKNRPDILDRIEYLHLEIHPFDQTVTKSRDLKEMVDAKFGDKVFYY